MTEDAHRTSLAAEKAADAVVRTSWFVRLLTLIAALATCVILVVWIVVSNRQATDQRARIQKELTQTSFLVQRVADATDPTSQFSQRANAQQAMVVKALILCLENHEDRLAAELAHTRVPGVMKGCP